VRDFLTGGVEVGVAVGVVDDEGLELVENN